MDGKEMKDVYIDPDEKTILNVFLDILKNTSS